MHCGWRQSYPKKFVKTVYYFRLMMASKKYAGKQHTHSYTWYTFPGQKKKLPKSLLKRCTSNLRLCPGDQCNLGLSLYPIPFNLIEKSEAMKDESLLKGSQTLPQRMIFLQMLQTAVDPLTIWHTLNSFLHFSMAKYSLNMCEKLQHKCFKDILKYKISLWCKIEIWPNY